MTPSEHVLILLDGASNTDKPGPEIRARLVAATEREETTVAEQAGSASGGWRITRHRYTFPRGDAQELWVLEPLMKNGDVVVEVFRDEAGPFLRLASR
ncbi:hypothetical protein [Streptomyces sp. NPDC086182]|uniref:hypothetical protein n=1 Tax=Streptomyces sp. NPDC086182 TaxID=3155058 RepID=UPI00342B86D6